MHFVQFQEILVDESNGWSAESQIMINVDCIISIKPIRMVCDRFTKKISFTDVGEVKSKYDERNCKCVVTYQGGHFICNQTYEEVIKMLQNVHIKVQ